LDLKNEKEFKLNEQQFRFFVETFRVSTMTTMGVLFKLACEYWGLIERDFTLFKISGDGEPESLADEMNKNV